MTKLIETDVVVVGAGLVGLSAAIAFARQGKRVVLVDAKPKAIKKTKSWDARIYAISPESQALLESLDVWQHVDAARVCPIEKMHLWHDAEELVFSSSEAHLSMLGVIVENQNLMCALWQEITLLDITVVTEVRCLKLENTLEFVSLHLDNHQQISAKLLVAADGTHSWVRQQVNIEVKHKDFQQTAIVANFKTEKPHANVAMQWFAPHETLALLPLVGQNISLVWSLPTERADALLKLSGDDLTRQVEMHTKHFLSELTLISDVFSYKLSQQTAMTMTAERIVLIGDAAHQVHPMAGQGVNLGFRDVMELSYLATKLNPMQDLGDEVYLRQFARARKADNLAINVLTSGLDTLFATDSRMLQQLTNWGLKQLNRRLSVKKILIQQVAA